MMKYTGLSPQNTSSIKPKGKRAPMLFEVKEHSYTFGGFVTRHSYFGETSQKYLTLNPVPLTPENE